MLVDHERVAGRGGDVARRGFGGALGSEVAAPHVLEQGGILRGRRHLLGGLRPCGGRRRAGERRIHRRFRLVLGHHAERLEGMGQIHRLRAHTVEQIAEALEAIPHVVDPEVLRLEPALEDLVPRERRRDRRAQLGSHRVRRRDVGARPVHVVVDEDLPGAVGDLPRHRHPVGVGLLDHPARRADERAHGVVRVGAAQDRDEDLETGGTARLGERRQPQLVEQHLDVPSHREHVLVRVRLERVEVEEQVVRMRDVAAACVQRVELDAAQVGDVEQSGGVVDREVVDLALLRIVALDHASSEPVRRVRGRRLLVEGLAVDAVGHPLHRERMVGQVRHDQLADVEVVVQQVALGVALVGPEDLREVGQAKLATVHLEPPRIAVAPRLDRPRHRHGERFRTRSCALPLRRHASMLAASAA